MAAPTEGRSARISGREETQRVARTACVDQWAGTLVAAQVAGQPLDVLVAADDAEAKHAVLALVEADGLRGIDAGPLRRARELDVLRPKLGATTSGRAAPPILECRTPVRMMEGGVRCTVLRHV